MWPSSTKLESTGGRQTQKFRWMLDGEGQSCGQGCGKGKELPPGDNDFPVIGSIKE